MSVFVLSIFMLVATASAFLTHQQPMSRRCDKSKTVAHAKILEGISDFFENFDDVMDDFMNKRMGNGEVFYGKRKYQPSGKPNTEGYYNGMGMSDKSKIELVREYKEDLMERRQRQTQQMAGEK
ncbi:hypothetical protein MPSEU_000824300 [Mayamaea pseudoterrestris]|nr:hypothetical protein MPSEU_000824300 [Mayamaea pseudoterrestris]